MALQTTVSELEQLQKFEMKLKDEIKSCYFCDGEIAFKKLARLALLHSDCLKYMAIISIRDSGIRL